MTEFMVRLPDELAQRAQSEGLLSDQAIQRLLEDAMRRAAGKRLLETARQLQEVSGEPMSMDEITDLVNEVRAERSTRQ